MPIVKFPIHLIRLSARRSPFTVYRLPGIALAMAFALSSCGGGKSPPGPVSYQSVKFKKAAAWVEKGDVLGQFGLVNEKDQPLAMAGRLTLSFYAQSNVSVTNDARNDREGAENGRGGPSFEVKSELFRADLPVKVADFRWIYYHSFLTDDDFVCSFKVPLSQLKNRPPGGRFIRFKISFKPDAYPSAVEEEKNLWIPSES